MRRVTEDFPRIEVSTRRIRVISITCQLQAASMDRYCAQFNRMTRQG
jgi:hypothetical protein